MPQQLALRYAGAYGRDGPQRAVQQMNPAYYPSSPRQLHIDPNDTRPLYSPVGIPPSPARATPPPSYSDSGHHDTHYVSLEAPNVALVEASKFARTPNAWPFTPSSPCSTEATYENKSPINAYDQTNHYNRSAQPLVVHSSANDSAKQMELAEKSDWLKGQQGKRKGCVFYAWCLFFLLLASIAGVIVWSRIHSAPTSHSSDEQPAVLTWANRPFTTTSVGESLFNSMSSTASMSVPTPFSRSRARKRHFAIAH